VREVLAKFDEYGRSGQIMPEDCETLLKFGKLDAVLVEIDDVCSRVKRAGRGKVLKYIRDNLKDSKLSGTQKAQRHTETRPGPQDERLAKEWEEDREKYRL
jgi:hypothetical protein